MLDPPPEVGLATTTEELGEWQTYVRKMAEHLEEIEEKIEEAKQEEEGAAQSRGGVSSRRPERSVSATWQKENWRAKSLTWRSQNGGVAYRKRCGASSLRTQPPGTTRHHLHRRRRLRLGE